LRSAASPRPNAAAPFRDRTPNMLSVLRFVFLLLASTAGILAQGQSDLAFTREFGPSGAPGSFRARFARQGGGIVFLQAMDHFVSLDAAQKEVHTPEDYLLLLVNGDDHALRLAHEPRSAAFPMDTSVATWVESTTTDGVTFTLDGEKGLVLEKVLRHDPQQRGFVFEIVLRNTGSDAVGDLNFQLTGPVLVNPSETSLFGDLAVAIAAPLEGDPVVVKPAAGLSQPLDVDPRALSFVGSTNRFFGAFLWPSDDQARAALTQIDVAAVPPVSNEDTRTKAHSTARLRYGVRLAVPSAGGETRVRYGIYLGPKSYRVFDTLAEPAKFAPILDIDLDAPCCGGVTVPGGRPMAKMLLKLLGWFYDVIGNWGFAIMMLTILVRGAMAPLNFRMQKSMRAFGAKMAKLKPKMDEMKKKYADDPKAYQQAMMAFNREHKVMPPLGGCLPIFLTMPIYLGLFTALRTAYDLRHQPFVSWMDDLSRADALFHLPFWPDQFNLLPLLWIVMFVGLQLRMPLPTDPQQRQMQMMMRFMPMLFGVMLYNYASALMVYMVTSMVWSLIESSIIKRILGPIDPNVAAMAPQAI
jgi:YidC/Oxa1 family membrane protein insertase